jgi:hypothetical protein
LDEKAHVKETDIKAMKRFRKSLFGGDSDLLQW